MSQLQVTRQRRTASARRRGRWSLCSAWTLEIPTSSVRSNCSANHGGLVVSGHPHEWVTVRGSEWCICLAPPVGRYASFHAE